MINKNKRKVKIESISGISDAARDATAGELTEWGNRALAPAYEMSFGLRRRWPKPQPQGEEAAAKVASKTKFTRPECGLNALAKSDAPLGWGACNDDMLVGSSGGTISIMFEMVTP
jgi:hypothetical protein